MYTCIHTHDVLQCVAVCCSVLQCVAVCCSIAMCVGAVCQEHTGNGSGQFLIRSMLQCGAVWCSDCYRVLQGVAVPVAVCRSVLPCVAVCFRCVAKWMESV